MDSRQQQRLVEAVTREVLAQLGVTEGRGAAVPVDRDSQELRIRPLVSANWKMNGCKPDLATYLAELGGAPCDEVDVLLIPPAVQITAVRDGLEAAGLSAVEVGGQDVHWEPGGAHTGELSGELLWAAGARWALVGHSERREAGETDTEVAKKIRAGWEAGLSVMLCIGEQLADRRSGATFRVLRQQLQLALASTALAPPEPHRLAVAYEPVWAIGTGERATPAQIGEAAAYIRRVLGEIYDFPRARRLRVLYGGSVKPATANEVMSIPDVDGVLVGGASLEGRSFGGIVSAGAEVAATRRERAQRSRP